MKQFFLIILLNSLLVYVFSQVNLSVQWPQLESSTVISETRAVDMDCLIQTKIPTQNFESNSWFEDIKEPMSSDYTNYWIDSSGNNLRNIQVSRSPQEVLITNDDRYVCVRSFLSNTVEIIKISTGEMIKSIMVPSPKDFVINHDGTKLIVASLMDRPMPPIIPPEDCTIFGIGLTRQSVLTTIEINSWEISKVDTIKTWSINRLLKSSVDSIIYLQGQDVIEYDLANSTVLRSWIDFDQIWHSKIDNKNKRIFLTTMDSTHENFLKAIDLITGEIITAQCYTNGEDAWPRYIGMDTLSNRVFIQGKYQPHSEVLVFDAISLNQLPPIVSAYLGKNSFVTCPSMGSIFIGGGYPNGALELDYQTLQFKQILPLPKHYYWHTILPSEDESKLFTYRYGSAEGGLSLLNPPKYLDISEYDINTGHLRHYTTTENKHSCCYMRSLATTHDGQFLIATNSPENTISIFGISDHGIEVSNSSNFMNVFPNPTSGIITVSINKQIDVDFEIKIFDCIGSMIYKSSRLKSDTNFKIDLSMLTKGQYFIHLNSSKESCIRKVIKF